VVVHTCNLNTGEAEVGGPRVAGQLWPDSKTCFTTTNKNKLKNPIIWKDKKSPKELHILKTCKIL
jgi:hypothetical protein